ncbi:hypothetical protein KAU05_00120 [Candidatus Aerophobetes bacterium]|nr:hypothetical protein [Candidatus Aerophobetes bacterium]
MKQEIHYFEEPGPKNTEQTIKIAYRRAKELNIDQIVVASTHGGTAGKVLDAFQDMNSKIVVVTISQAFHQEGWIMEDEVRNGRGADTAVVIKPAHAQKFLSLEIREILAKPRKT